MTNKITSSISKVVTDKRSHEFKSRIDNLPGNNWTKEIKELATEFSLDAEHIIADIKHFLTDTLTPEHIEHELKENAKEYKKFYEIMKNESFKEAEEIVESLSAYIEKLKTNTQKRLTHVLLANPGSAHRMPAFMKNVLGEDIPEKESIIEEKEIISDKHQHFVDELTTILEQTLDQETETEIIETLFRTTFDFRRMSWMSFYKELGLDETYTKKIKGVQAKIIQLLIIIQKNPADEHAKKDLEIQIQRYLDPAFKTPWELGIQKPGVTIVGTVDLSKFPQGKKDKKIEVVKEAPEIMQNPTINHLDYVGTEMSQSEFVTKCGLSYKELNSHKRSHDAIPARYFRSIDVKDNPDRKAHFFTVWEEDVFDHTRINVYVETDASEKFIPNTIYKIKITGVQNSKNAWEKWKQIMSIRWELVLDEVESVWSGNFLWWAKWSQKLRTFISEN